MELEIQRLKRNGREYHVEKFVKSETTYYDSNWGGSSTSLIFKDTGEILTLKDLLLVCSETFSTERGIHGACPEHDAIRYGNEIGADYVLTRHIRDLKPETCSANYYMRKNVRDRLLDLILGSFFK